MDNITKAVAPPSAEAVVEATVKALNQFLKLDPEACNKLVSQRVQVKDGVTGLIVEVQDDNRLGLIGVLNGILASVTGKKVALMIDNKNVVGFQVYQPPA